MNDIVTMKRTLTACSKVANRDRWRAAVQHRSARLGGLCKRLTSSLGARFVRRERRNDDVAFLARDDLGQVVEAVRIIGVSGQHTVAELDTAIDVRVLLPELFVTRIDRKDSH